MRRLSIEVIVLLSIVMLPLLLINSGKGTSINLSELERLRALEFNDVTVVHEGFTLTDIFETNNLVHDVTKFLHSNFTYLNGVLSIPGNVAFRETTAHYHSSFNAILGDKIYYSLDARTTIDVTHSMQLFLLGPGNPFVNFDYSLPNTDFVNYTGFIDIVATGSYTPRLDNNNLEMLVVADFTNIFIINMSIFNEVPAQSQLSNWRDMYLDNYGRILEEFENQELMEFYGTQIIHGYDSFFDFSYEVVGITGDILAFFNSVMASPFGDLIDFIDLVYNDMVNFFDNLITGAVLDVVSFFRDILPF